MQENQKSLLSSIPGAIIVAGIIVGLAIVWSNQTPRVPIDKSNTEVPTGPVVSFRSIDESDHLLGNPNAQIILLEYSDTSCPYCKVFKDTMDEIMITYGASGTVAWAYRHFPLDFPDPSGRILHPKANREAQATECAAELGGNSKFWTYIRTLYKVTPGVTSASPNGLEDNQLYVIAEQIGLDKESFGACLDSGKYKEKVVADQTDGINAGVRGTPHSILVLRKPVPESFNNVIDTLRLRYGMDESMIYVSRDRTKVVLVGALPFEIVKPILDSLLTSLQ